MSDNRFERTERLIGQAAVRRLQNCSVAVFGVGGVGSYVAEALARGGVGRLELFDSDRVERTNINRQLIALESTVGRYKSEVMAERARDINPDITAVSHVLFVTPEEAEKIDFSAFDYVVDAVDNVTAKIAICRCARLAGVPVISAMGAGNKLDPTRFEVAPVEKTSVCPLARVMRSELKKRGITGVKAVFSKEPARTPVESAPDGKGGRPVPASISFVPSAAGLILAGTVITDLIQ